MMQVITVRGPIAAEELGFTSIHEHIFLDSQSLRERAEKMGIVPENPPIDRNERVSLNNRGYLRSNLVLSLDNLRLDAMETAIGEVEDFKAVGGSAILEVSVPGLRSTSNDVLALRRISERTGVHIVVCTGLYAEDTWPEEYRGMTIDQWAEHMRREIDQGIGDTGIKPGQIKAAYDVPSPRQDEFLRAAVRVSKETGLSIQVHKGMLMTPDDVFNSYARVLDEENADPARTILCHAQGLASGITGFNLDGLVQNPRNIPFNLEPLQRLLDKGYNLSIDTFGSDWNVEAFGHLHLPDWYMLGVVFALVKAGYARQIVMGHDIFLKIDQRRGGGHGFTRIPTFVVPTLARLGVSESDILLMTVENPARILAI
jgi:phosphotriesterase-related protein